MSYQTLDEYLDFLIPPPNSIQPKFVAWVSALLQVLLDTQDVLQEVIEAFHVDTAVGKQLDIVGQILGRSRRINFQPSDGSSPVLNDDDYRLILKAKIIQNQWRGTKPEIYEFWTLHFPDIPIIVVDNGDMTIDVHIIGLTVLQQELAANFYYFPKPAGVRINFFFGEEYDPGANPLFAYDRDTDTMKGYDQGYWARA